MNTTYVIIRGAMGVGKSQVAKLLSQQYGCPHVKGDDCWQWCTNPTARQREELYDTVYQRFIELKGLYPYVFFDWVTIDEHVLYNVTDCVPTGCKKVVITLIATEQTLTERITNRGGDEQEIARALDRQRRLYLTGKVIDNTKLSVKETAEKIKELLC